MAATDTTFYEVGAVPSAVAQADDTDVYLQNLSPYPVKWFRSINAFGLGVGYHLLQPGEGVMVPNGTATSEVYVSATHQVDGSVIGQRVAVTVGG